jgi:hypothetical protein
MSYHNIRDKSGRFAKKTDSPVRRKYAKVRPLKVTTPTPVEETVILNVFLLDDSGSMSPKKVATIEGFNAILATARQTEQDTGIPTKDFLCKFGSPRRETWASAAVPLDLHSYHPSQPQTALNDAIVFAIGKTDNEILALGGKKAKVIFTIFTDGLENASFNRPSTVKAMIDARNAKDWVITYVGAGTQAEVERRATDIGIYASNSLGYTNDSAGTKRSMFSAASAKVSYSSKVAAGTDSNIGYFGE